MKWVPVLAAVAGLAGCGSVPAPARMAPAKDTERMAQIERAAARNGVKVYWINPPTKTVARPGP